MKEGKLFDAMDMFEQVKTPPGMYNLAQVLFVSFKEYLFVIVKGLHFLVICRVEELQTVVTTHTLYQDHPL